ncbi:MAG: PQQ-dependent sugar dehydrogenase [Hyphomonadaceae bacterium]|nr:PQQ-dependent sugar dehydrogenase [Hyphomonadaceae bacterium]
MNAFLSWLSPLISRWRALPQWLQLILSLAIIGGFALLIFLAGFQTAYREVGPYSLLDKIDRKITSRFASQAIPALEDQTYPTILLTLSSNVAKVDTGLEPDRRGRIYQQGGGLTSLGEDVLLLPYSGQVLAARSADDIRATQIFGPDRGEAAYLEAANAPDSGMNFHLGYLRYNDFKHITRSDGTHQLVASYSEFHEADQCATNTVAVVSLPEGVTNAMELSIQPEDWQVIFRAEPCLPLKTKHFAMEGQMASGQLEYDGTSTLYLSSGDYHFDGMRTEDTPIAQDPNADYGKVIAIDLDTGVSRLLSYGHRNMQGMAIGADGALYVSEHGPRGGDELNRISPNGPYLNYGWPVASLGTAYSATPLPTAETLGRHDGYEPPVVAWMPSVALSGMTLVQGFHEAWEGDLLIGSLNDRALHRVRLQGDRALYIERIPFDTRIRQVHQHSDGRIVLWTDNQELIFLSAEDLASPAEQIPAYLASLDAPARVKAEFETVMERCIECHSLNDGNHTAAPSLARIYDNDIASTGYVGYSEALKDASGRWTHDQLTAFLMAPDDFAPGTYMPAVEIEDRRTAEEIATYLAWLDRQF